MRGCEAQESPLFCRVAWQVLIFSGAPVPWNSTMGPPEFDRLTNFYKLANPLVFTMPQVCTPLIRVLVSYQNK